VSHLFAELMGRLQAKAASPVDKASKATSGAIENWPCDFTLKRLLQWHWFTEPVDVGFTMLSTDRIVEGEMVAHNLEAGHLQIGECPNGDRVYLRTSDYSVWYWSHDESDDWNKLQVKALHQVYRSLASLLISVFNETFVPCDSYSGREYFLLMEGRPSGSPPN
jgi:hypothetical protein